MTKISEIDDRDTIRERLAELLAPLGEVEWDNPLSQQGTRAAIRIGSKRFYIILFVKPSGEPRFIKQFLGEGKTNAYPVVVAPYISERGRSMCIENGAGYIDLSGNAYLRFGPVLINVRGRENRWKDNRALKRLFTPATTFLLRRMFLDTERTWTMTGLSAAADVSIGQVSKTVNRFAQDGLMDKRKGCIKLARPGAILDLWRDVYRFEDNSSVGYYCPIMERTGILERLRGASRPFYALTLGTASSLVAPSVRSTDVFMYVANGGEDIIGLLELRPVEFGGSVYLVEPRDRGVLFDIREIDGLRLVSNLQLYLDLYNYPARGREQAVALREQVLKV